MVFPFCFLRRFLLVFLVGILLPVPALFAAEQIVLQLSRQHQFQFAGYYMALEQGYYRDAGLSVDIFDYELRFYPVDEVLSGAAQFGVSDSRLLVENGRGKPVVALASIFQHSPEVFIALEESGVRSPQDMLGRSVMVCPGFRSPELIALLGHENLLERIHRIDSSLDPLALVRGEAEVYNGYSGDEPYLLEKQGHKVTVIDPQDYGIDFYGDTLFTSQAFLEAKPKVVEAFRQASLRGWLYALEHVDEAIDLIRRKYRPDKSVEQLAFEAAKIREAIDPEMFELGHMDRARWSHLVHHFIALGYMSPSYSLEREFLYEPPHGVHWDRLRPWLVGVCVVFTACLLFVVALLSAYARLRRTRNRLRQEIRDREKVEEALQLSRFAVDRSGDAAFWMDRDLKIIYVNEEACRSLGYSRRELYAMRLPEIRADWTEADCLCSWQVLESDGIQRYEGEFRRKDGTIFSVEVTANYVEFKEESYNCFFARDITEKQAARQVLLKTTAEFEAIFESITDAVVFVNPQRQVQRLNQSFTEMFGYSLDDLRGQTTEVIYADPEEYENLRQQRYNPSAQSHQTIYEMKYRRLDGTLFPGETMAVKVHDPDGTVLGYAAIIRDISLRKQQEASQLLRVRQQEALAELGQLALDDLPLDEFFEFIVTKVTEVLDADFIKILKLRPDGQLLFVAGAGWRDGLMGTACVPADSDSQAGYTLQSGGAVLVNDLATETRFSGPELLREHQVASGISVVIGPHEVPWGVLAVHDRSQDHFRPENIPFLQTIANLVAELLDRKHAEAQRVELELQLRQSYKMEAIGVLAGGIAHDFNNILAIILGNAELAFDGILPNSSAAGNLEQIREASLRAKTLVQQILAFSRRESAQLIPVDLVVLVRESISMLRSTIPTSVEILNHCEASDKTETHFLIQGDSTQLQQILINLCANAMHAMGDKGVLGIGLNSASLQFADLPGQRKDLKPGLYACLSIRDTGAGMSAEVLEKIFDPFFTTKGVGEGTGMGLAVVHGIVENHGGFIDVESVVGQGSCFRIYFPVCEQREEKSEQEETPVACGHERILFLDDEQMLADIGSAMLRHQGFQVTTLTSSYAALELFQQDPNAFDLVFTDQTMPELSGLELSRELLKIRPDLPIVLCTGYSRKVSEQEALAAGIRAFCLKPLDLRQTVCTVRQVLDEAFAGQGTDLRGQE